MDTFTTLLTPSRCANSFCCTPDNGLLYISNSRIVYVPAITFGKVPNALIWDTKNRLTTIDCDPDWAITNYCAFLTEQNELYVGDLKSKEIIKGHIGHSKKSKEEKLKPGVMCITNKRRVITTDQKEWINYCMVTNQFTCHEIFLPKKTIITLLKPSPYNSDIVAAGTQDGLVVILSLKDMSITFTLRGHDNEITSLDWMKIKQIKPLINKNSVNSSMQCQSKSQPQPQTQQIADNSDIFDIYSFDDLDNEFGTLQDMKGASSDDDCDTSGSKKQDIIKDNEKFNFIEACQSLKDDMLATKEEVDDETKKNFDYKANAKSPLSTTSYSQSEDNFSSHSNISDVSDINRQLKDFVLLDKGSDVDSFDNIFLASAGKERVIWIWNSTTGAAVEKISVKHSSKSTTYGMSVIWLNEKVLLSNGIDGELIQWNLSFSSESKINYKHQIREHSLNQITNLIKMFDNENSNTSIFWSNSWHGRLCCTEIVDDDYKIIADFCTTYWGTFAMEGNPLDMNKIGFGGGDKIIFLLNASTLQPNHIKLTPLINKIKSRIFTLAWHPINENLLAFGTSEGRIGIFNTNTANANPILMKNFSGKVIYCISYGFLTNEKLNNCCVLFACSDGKCVYYPEAGENKFSPIQVHVANEVTSVSAGTIYLAIGTQKGLFYLCDLRNDLKEIANIKLSNKYICDIGWSVVNSNFLAISSNDIDIFILNCDDLIDQTFSKFCKLSGHKDGVTSLKWSHNLKNRLVSTSFDKTVRVWDTETQICISVCQFDCPMFAALFSPSDDNLIFCGGYNFFLYVFDIRSHSPENYKDSVISCSKRNSIEMGILINANPKLHVKMEKNKNRKILRAKSNKKGDITESVSEENEKSIGLDSEFSIKHNESDKFKLDCTTILYLSNNEQNKESLDCIRYMLTPQAERQNSKNYFNVKMFSDSKTVKELLMSELKNHHESNTKSIGNLILPQICGNLHEEIVNKIAKKSLTEEYVAIAPMISYSFWQKCCEAFAYQKIEQGFVLGAVPYFLACHNVNDAIQSLCDRKHFREAWILAKMRKDEKDPIFISLSENWISYLDSTGNLEAGAMICTGLKNFKGALELLQKRKNHTEEIEQIIELLKQNLQ